MKPVFVVLVVLTALAVTAAASPNETRRPTKTAIQVQTRAAVAASGASLVSLTVVPPNQSYALTIRVAHPARYLRYRINRLVDVINRLTNVQWRFHSRSFTVRSPSGQVFWFDQSRTAGSEQTRWNVRRDLQRCIDTIPFDIEVDPDNVAPPCPT